MSSPSVLSSEGMLRACLAARSGDSRGPEAGQGSCQDEGGWKENAALFSSLLFASECALVIVYENLYSFQGLSEFIWKSASV